MIKNVKASKTATVDEHNLIAKKILSHLIKGPMRQNAVFHDAITDSAGVNKTHTVFYWLRDNGFIRKTSVKHTAPYEVTEKGKKYFECI